MKKTILVNFNNRSVNSNQIKNDPTPKSVTFKNVDDECKSTKIFYSNKKIQTSGTKDIINDKKKYILWSLGLKNIFDTHNSIRMVWKMRIRKIKKKKQKLNVPSIRKKLLFLVIFTWFVRLINGTTDENYVSLDDLKSMPEKEKFNTAFTAVEFKFPGLFYFDIEKEKFYIFDFNPKHDDGKYALFYENDSGKLDWHITHTNNPFQIKANRDHPELPIVINITNNSKVATSTTLYPINKLFDGTEYKEKIETLRKEQKHDLHIHDKLKFLKTKGPTKLPTSYYDDARKLVKLQKQINDIKNNNHVLTLEELQKLDDNIEEMKIGPTHLKKIQKLQTTKLNALKKDISSVLKKEKRDDLRKEIHEFQRVFEKGYEIQLFKLLDIQTKVANLNDKREDLDQIKSVIGTYEQNYGIIKQGNIQKVLASKANQIEILYFKNTNEHFKQILEALGMYRLTYEEHDEESMKKLNALQVNKPQEIKNEINKIKNPTSEQCDKYTPEIKTFLEVFNVTADDKDFTAFLQKCESNTLQIVIVIIIVLLLLFLIIYALTKKNPDENVPPTNSIHQTEIECTKHLTSKQNNEDAENTNTSSKSESDQESTSHTNEQILNETFSSKELTTNSDIETSTSLFENSQEHTEELQNDESSLSHTNDMQQNQSNSNITITLKKSKQSKQNKTKGKRRKKSTKYVPTNNDNDQSNEDQSASKNILSKKSTSKRQKTKKHDQNLTSSDLLNDNTKPRNTPKRTRKRRKKSTRKYESIHNSLEGDWGTDQMV